MFLKHSRRRIKYHRAVDIGSRRSTGSFLHLFWQLRLRLLICYMRLQSSLASESLILAPPNLLNWIFLQELDSKPQLSTPAGSDSFLHLFWLRRTKIGYSRQGFEAAAANWRHLQEATVEPAPLLSRMSKVFMLSGFLILGAVLTDFFLFGGGTAAGAAGCLGTGACCAAGRYICA